MEVVIEIGFILNSKKNQVAQKDARVHRISATFLFAGRGRRQVKAFKTKLGLLVFRFSLKLFLIPNMTKRISNMGRMHHLTLGIYIVILKIFIL